MRNKSITWLLQKDNNKTVFIGHTVTVQQSETKSRTVTPHTQTKVLLHTKKDRLYLNAIHPNTDQSFFFHLNQSIFTLILNLAAALTAVLHINTVPNCTSVSSSRLNIWAFKVAPDTVLINANAPRPIHRPVTTNIS